VASAQVTDNTLTSADILNGTIANGDISNTAAISGTKIAPNFGSQNIVTTGNITGRELFANTGLDYTAVQIGQQGNDRIYADNSVSKGYGGGIWFRVNNSGTGYIDAMSIAETGNVGIGVNTPSQKLTVNGNVQASSFIGNGSALTNLNASNITTGTLTGSVLPNTVVLTSGDQTIAGTKTFSSPIAGSITGNAATATILQTARTIGGVSFNGSTNINLPGVNIAGNQNTTGNAATATALQNARTINGISFNGTANIETTRIGSKNNLAAETLRNIHDTGIYTYNSNNLSLGDSTPTGYWSTIAFGRGQAGSAQIAANWTSGGNELWFRSLRDVTDNWWTWKRIWHSGNF
ncbi:MAG TPA: hypothetical protein PKC87_06555, partial [Candidatus Absconditabacterales bacterium]|nr:hypothetical protein [Candidatus Absconditabacterales bacterium]